MSVLFAALLVADTILVTPFATKGDAPQGAGVAVAEAILDVVVQANADSFLTLKQLDAVLRRRDLSLDDAGLSLLAAELGRTLGIEEVGVLPQFRRMGVARLLLAHALQKREGAVITVGESNMPARALYRSLGFRQSTRRLLMELRHG